MKDVLSPAQDRGCGIPRTEPVENTRPVLGMVSPIPVASVDPKPSKAAERAQEIELMRAVAAHQPQAEAELVRRVIGQVRSRARVLARNMADADDAAQTAIVEILRSAANFRGDGSLAGWCERITVRTTLRLQRKRDRASGPIDAAVRPDDVATTTSAEPSLSDGIPGGDVERFLLELSDERYQALVLRHVLDHSIEEIAEQTGVSVNTVKDRLRMARQLVRQSIRQREVIASVKARRE